MVRNPADVKHESVGTSVGEMLRNLQEAAMGVSGQGDKSFSPKIQKTKY